MSRPKLVRITTIPLSLEKLLEGQLRFMEQHFEVVAVSSEKERLDKYGQKEGVRTFFLNLTRKITPLKDIISVYRLYRFLCKEQPLICHTHTPKAGIVGMLASYLARVPIRLHTVAGLPLMEASGFKLNLLRQVEKLTYRFATGIYSNSRGLYDYIINERLARGNKIKVLGEGSSNGIDTSFFDASIYSEDFKIDLRANFGISDRDLVFIFVGRIVRDKGIHELLEAFQRLHSDYTNISLLLVGPLESDLDPLSSSALNIIERNDKIRILGYKEDVRPYFAISDALVFPSYREGFPNVVMQAGAMGLPTIASDINGCNEIIQPNQNGWLVPPKDVNALYLAMKQFCDNKDTFQKNEKRIRKIIKDRYERRDMWMTLLNEYRILIEQHDMKSRK